MSVTRLRSAWLLLTGEERRAVTITAPPSVPGPLRTRSPFSSLSSSCERRGMKYRWPLPRAVAAAPFCGLLDASQGRVEMCPSNRRTIWSLFQCSGSRTRFSRTLWLLYIFMHTDAQQPPTPSWCASASTPRPVVCSRTPPVYVVSRRGPVGLSGRVDRTPRVGRAGGPPGGRWWAGGSDTARASPSG